MLDPVLDNLTKMLGFKSLKALICCRLAQDQLITFIAHIEPFTAPSQADWTLRMDLLL